MKNIRLEKIADMVMKGVTAADIGTDHALLPVMLVERNVCPRVYACDIAEGPLLAAEATIKKAAYQDKIPVILSNGLDHVPTDAEVCILAGMGCMTAVEILSRGEERIAVMKQIIVEVNRDVIKMRQWIGSHGYTIDDEGFVNDRSHDYVILSFHRSNKPQEYTKEDIILGPILKKRKEPEYLAYCHRQIQKIQKILLQSHGNAFQKETVEQELAVYKAYLKQ